MKKNNAIYIGGGITANGLLYTIPVAINICKKYKIKRIIFESYLEKKILNISYIKVLLSPYKIEYINDLLPIYIKSKYFFLVLNLFEIIFLFLRLNRKNILNKNNSFFQKELLHSAWDSSIRKSKDGIFLPNAKNRFTACLNSIRQKNIAKFLFFKKNVSISILAHTVYEHRSLLSSFRKYKVKLFHINGFNFFKQGNLQDKHWELINKKFFKSVKQFISLKDLNKYWLLRNKGKMGNYEAKIATQLKSNFKGEVKSNVIMLHVFRDSPYAFIKGERIFCDFIDWFTKTLEIISRSEEQWQIRLHPVAKSWGEDQEIWIKNILKKVNYKNNNIFIDRLYFSNKEIFNKAKRVVTFSGTGSIEAAANGIKPITIAENTLHNLSPNLTLKAKNLKHYEDLLLKNSDSRDFQINSKLSIKAKYCLFIREELLTILSDVGATKFFLSDNKKKINKDFMNISNKLKNNDNYFHDIADILCSKIGFSFKKKYIKFIKHK